MPTLEFACECNGAGSNFVARPAWFEPDVDVHASITGRLRIPDDLELIEERPDVTGSYADVVEGVAGLWVEVDPKLIAVLRIGDAKWPKVESQAAEVHRPQHVGDILDDQRVRCRAIRRLHDGRCQPARRIVGHALLEKGASPRTVREALEEGGTAGCGYRQASATSR